MTEHIEDAAKQKSSDEGSEELDWIDMATWIRMGDTCCGDEVDGEDS